VVKRAPQKTKILGTFESWAQQLDDNKLLCRDLGHSWRPTTAQYDSKQRIFTQAFRCARCETLRQRTLSQHGDILAAAYRYSTGYVAPKGSGSLSASARSSLRLISVGRLLQVQADS
jgi:hypothetical protein